MIRWPERLAMTTTLEPRRLRMFRNAIANFPAVWHFIEPRPGAIEAETTNPAETILLRICAYAQPETIIITASRASDGDFMAEAQFPLASWQSAKEMLEGIALEAFVVGVDLREGKWSGSMFVRSADLDRRRDFSYVRSWLGTFDQN
jgi:hypothetical protein